MNHASSLREPIARIAREAGRIILEHGAFRVEQKEGHANFVTNVDRAVQDCPVPASSAKSRKTTR